MTDITPPPELAAIWVAEIYGNGDPAIPLHPITLRLVERAAQWGYDQRGKVNESKLQEARDQELEACCEWLNAASIDDCDLEPIADDLRAARRPKSPSLKEQALALIDDCTDPHGDYLDDNALSTIRRALEALPDD